jgi:hypothetical protein
VAKADIKCMAETKAGVPCTKTAFGTYPMPMPFWCSLHPHTVQVTLHLCLSHAPLVYRNVWRQDGVEGPDSLCNESCL